MELAYQSPHDVHAVRIERRDQNHDGVAPDGARVVVLVSHKLLGEHHRREDAADFRGVDARRDEDDELAVDLELSDLSWSS